jgi:hypothetical protein
MFKSAVVFVILVGSAVPAQAASQAGWRVQQACALQRYLRATPAFAAGDWARDASSVSLGGSAYRPRSRQDPQARARFDGAMRSGRAFADRAASQLAARERITQEEAFRKIGADPGPWPQVTADQCAKLERKASRSALVR